MKTQVIHLDPLDDLSSVLDKLQFSHANRVVLVWPERKIILEHKADLVRLKRRATQQGALIALVVRNFRMNRIAQEVGIQVFQSTGRAMRATWPNETSSFPKNKSGNLSPEKLRLERRYFQTNMKLTRLTEWIRTSLFSLSILVVALSAVMIFPRAEIKISTAPYTQDVGIPVHASERESQVRLSGMIPSHSSQLIVEATSTLPTTGMISLPEKPATGTAQFTNLTDQEITIPTGTLVTTLAYDPLKYRTSTTRTIPAGAGSTIDIPIQAMDAGSKANQPAKSIQLINGELSGQLLVTNLAPIIGGIDIQKRAPNESDQRALKKVVLAKLEETAISKFSSALGSQNRVIEPSLQLSKILDETYTPAKTEVSDEITIRMQVEFRVNYVAISDLRNLASQVLNARLQPNEKAIAESLNLEDIRQPYIDNEGNYSWEISAKRKVAKETDVHNITRSISGIQRSEAEARLRSAVGWNSLTDLKISPSWWPWMPIFPFRINILEINDASTSS